MMQIIGSWTRSLKKGQNATHPSVAVLDVLDFLEQDDSHDDDEDEDDDEQEDEDEEVEV